jgi:hypothetical protein
MGMVEIHKQYFIKICRRKLKPGVNTVGILVTFLLETETDRLVTVWDKTARTAACPFHL